MHLSLHGCIRVLVFVQLIKSTDEIVSIYYRRLEHGYPTPSLDRDKCVAPLDAKTILRRAPPLI